jgi:O-antigen/teichoic acid export membrane protein
MEAILAAAGGVLLLFGVTGGITRIRAERFEKDEFVPLLDRVAAILIGAALIGLAAVLEAGYRSDGLWAALAFGAAVVLAYAGYLLYQDRRQKKLADLAASANG